MDDSERDAAPVASPDAEFLALRRDGAAQATALQAQAAAGGLRFEAYLLPRLATWLLGLIARGDFADPSEAVFVLLGEQQEIEEYPDLRAELLRRTIDAAANDPRPAIPADVVIAEIASQLAAPLPAAAMWPRHANPARDPGEATS